ncbi:glycosyltransferase [Methanobrevibacter arboriphilus]|uniref:glycosyltransferase n=1 Tax=Methanobrevibacter arboriphilus TaxID=39441 RepID=UPI0006D0003A|nr:glycosyltransferase [Methanobrevibacter arboriphilus]
MDNVKISVIIPVYNAEKYLKQCLNSITKQTLRDIEIICINDGSTDNSLKILREYAEKDERFKIINQKNAGAGSARNVGLDNATGEYVSFIDADDWIKHKLYKKLYSIAEKENLDIIMFKMINYDHEKDKLYETNYYNLSELKKWFDGSLFSEKITKNKIFNMSVSPGGKFYKRSLIESINARYPEGIIFEDTPFYMETYLNAKRCKIINEYLYFRRRSEKSVTTQFDKHYEDIIYMSNILIDLFKKHDKYKSYKKGLFNFKIAFIRKKYNDIFKNREKLFYLIKKFFENE